MDKKTARKECFQILSTIDNKISRDQEISTTINEMIKKYEIVGVYSPFKNEIDLQIEHKGLVVYPVVEGKTMQFYENTSGFNVSKFGIKEPIIDKQKPVVPDVLIIPCVGYYHNYRLGYGGGFYDRYLSINNISTIGIAYKETELKSLQLNKYDLPLDTIIAK